MHNGYGLRGRGRIQDPWWRKSVVEKHLRVMVETIFGKRKGVATTGIRQAWRGEGGEEEL